MVQNLFEIKHIDGEEEEAFSGRTRAEYEADADVETVSVILEIPETSLSCGDDARDAHQSLVDAVAALNDDLTYISWLTDELEECCQDLEEKYEGIKIQITIGCFGNGRIEQAKIQNNHFVSMNDIRKLLILQAIEIWIMN